MSTAQIIRYIKGSYATNVYLVFDKETKDAFIIDPSIEFSEITRDIDMYGLNPKYIILTHGHGDHTGGIDYLKEEYPEIKLVFCKKEKNFIYDRDKSMGQGGIVADILVSDNDELEIGNIKLRFIETPGHTPGGMCVLMDDVLFSGDTLFFASVGRTDFIGGNTEQLIESIRTKLLCLPDKTLVLPGHMRETNIGFERNNNPYV